MKKTSLIALGLVLALLLNGCAAAAVSAVSNSAAASDMMAMESYDGGFLADTVSNKGTAAPAAAPLDNTGAGEASPYGQKIVYTAYLTITADSPADALTAAQEACTQLGGYVADSYQSANGDGDGYASATLKVPAEKLETLMERLSGLGKTDSCRLESDEITMDYYDIAARLSAARAEEEQLLVLLGNCTTIEEMLLVREQLAAVREQIESYQGRINLWDHQVAYATVELSLQAVQKTAVAGEGTLIELWSASDIGRRMSDGFQNGWRFLLNGIGAIGIVLANVLLPGIVVAAIVLGIVLLVRRSRKKRRKGEGKEPPRQQ